MRFAFLELVRFHSAVQRSTQTTTTQCKDDKCSAGRAIDGDLGTQSVTLGDTFSDWWIGQMMRTATVETILLYYTLPQGKNLIFKF